MPETKTITIPVQDLDYVPPPVAIKPRIDLQLPSPFLEAVYFPVIELGIGPETEVKRKPGTGDGANATQPENVKAAKAKLNAIISFFIKTSFK
jgi:hypothetical protein